MGYEMKEESLAGYPRHPGGDITSSSQDVDACWSWSDWALTRSAGGEWILRGILKDNWDDDLPPGNSGLRPALNDAGVDVGLSPPDFEALFDEIQATLSKVDIPHTQTSPDHIEFVPVTSRPTYQHHIEQCRESIRQGDSYELTLTTRFESKLPPQSDPYQLYLRLRSYNPAYYSTYVSLPDIPTSHGRGIHVLSSSPERFLKIDNLDGRRRVEMMPIKGTRKRLRPGQCACVEDTGCGGMSPGSEICERERQRVDVIHGEELRTDVKERAENLMVSGLNQGRAENQTRLWISFAPISFPVASLPPYTCPSLSPSSLMACITW